MEKKIKKNSIIFLIVVSTFFSLVSCKVVDRSEKFYSNIAPWELPLEPDEIKIDFIQLHNDVITDIMNQYTRFWFIDPDGFVISGTNEPKTITIDLNCVDGTKQIDIDAVLSMALNYIAIDIHTQNDKYAMPTFDSNENVYTDFGNVFDDFELIVHSKDRKGNTIVDYDFKPGEKITIEPRMWVEE